MLKTEVTTIRATFVGLTEGELPNIRLYKLIQRPGRGQKPISMSAPIRNEHLLERLRNELVPSDSVEITVETRWAEEGIPKTLLDFSKLSVSQDQVLTVAV